MTEHYVEVLEEGVPKIVPHTGKNHYLFIDKKRGNEFLERLIEKNPQMQFRMVTITKNVKFTNWKQKV